jgi:hypothetical protein
MKLDNMLSGWILALIISTTSAFSVTTTSIHKTSSNTQLTAAISRRETLFSAASIIALSFPLVASADVDYSKVQDLLGRPDSPDATKTYAPSGRPTYLEEPTEEFKRNEAKAADFKRLQLQRKQSFMKLLDKLDTDPNNQDLLAQDLDEMRRAVRASGGLPLGITKDELVKRIRRRKAKRYWPVQVEIAYQDLLQELRAQQNPNGKDEENPL